MPMHEFEETNRVADRMNAAHFVGVNRCDGDRFDPVTTATGYNEHLGFVIEALRTSQHVRDQRPMNHTKTALRIRNKLATNTADLLAHIAVNGTADPRPC